MAVGSDSDRRFRGAVDRVLPASGGVGGYAGGPAAKEHLLALEAAHAVRTRRAARTARDS